MVWVPHPELYTQPQGYEYPSYDAPRYPDIRPRIQLPPVYDFRDERYMYDFAPPQPSPPPPNLIGMTLNSLPFDVRARMGGLS